MILLSGCTAPYGKTGVNDNPVTVTTTMPVTVKAAVKNETNTPTSTQDQDAGGDITNYSVVVCGSGSVLLISVVVLGWKLFNSDKALHAVTSAIESLGYAAKTTAHHEAVAIGAEKYLRAKVKKWYKPNGSTEPQSQPTTTKLSK